MLGSVAEPALTEISGIAASRAHPVIWAHNDSGGLPRVYAIGLDGADRGHVDLDGAEAVDWEDMALLPGVPGDPGDWLLLADIGDNREARASVQIYRIPEPVPGEARSVRAARMDVRYPSGATNAESLVVDPRSGELFILSKVKDGASVLYALGPWTEGSVEARPVGAKAFPPGQGSVRTTAGDVSPDGRWMAIRTYTQVHLFGVGEGSLLDGLLSAGCDVPTPEEPQGEAVTFHDGRLILVSEGKNPPVYALPLGDPAP